MSPALTGRLPLDRPLDLRATVRMHTLWGPAPWVLADDSGAWFAQRTEDGPGTVHVAHRGDHLDLEAWGPGAARVLAAAPALVGLDDPGVEALAPHHPVVRAVTATLRGARLGRTGELYPPLIATALSQRVAGVNSLAALRRLVRRWGEPAPGPRDDLGLLPPPTLLARVPYHELHPLGIERHRAELVQRIASRASALERAATMSPPEARAHLERLRGIGPWTSGVVCGAALGDPDVVPTGDFHLPNVVTWALAGIPRGTDAQMMSLLAPWQGQRGRLARALKLAGPTPPRYGHRTGARDLPGW